MRKTSAVAVGMVSLLGLAGPACLAAPDTGDHPGLVVRVAARSATQISAFYEARGFPASALELLSKHCFFTVTIRNQGSQVVWLEPGSWRFHGSNTQTGGVAPLSLDYWRRQWQQVALPKSNQATFRWTQLPKQRDLQPLEPVGGNISIRPISGELELVLVFDTGKDRSGPKIRRKFSKLRCQAG